MPTQPPPIISKALEANFQQTASTVEISPRWRPLQEVVARYQGLASRLEHLLYEISHPYRNWQLIISELRPACGRFAKKILLPAAAYHSILLKYQKEVL